MTATGLHHSAFASTEYGGHLLGHGAGGRSSLAYSDAIGGLETGSLPKVATDLIHLHYRVSYFILNHYCICYVIRGFTMLLYLQMCRMLKRMAKTITLKSLVFI